MRNTPSDSPTLDNARKRRNSQASNSICNVTIAAAGQIQTALITREENSSPALESVDEQERADILQWLQQSWNTLNVENCPDFSRVQTQIESDAKILLSLARLRSNDATLAVIDVCTEHSTVQLADIAPSLNEKKQLDTFFSFSESAKQWLIGEMISSGRCAEKERGHIEQHINCRRLDNSGLPYYMALMYATHCGANMLSEDKARKIGRKMKALNYNCDPQWCFWLHSPIRDDRPTHRCDMAQFNVDTGLVVRHHDRRELSFSSLARVMISLPYLPSS